MIFNLHTMEQISEYAPVSFRLEKELSRWLDAQASGLYANRSSGNPCIPFLQVSKYDCWLQMESAFGDLRTQAQPGSMAADNRDSDNSEHQSGSDDQHSMCRQGAPDSASPSTKAETAEGAGETGGPRMLP